MHIIFRFSFLPMLMPHTTVIPTPNHILVSLFTLVASLVLSCLCQKSCQSLLTLRRCQNLLEHTPRSKRFYGLIICWLSLGILQQFRQPSIKTTSQPSASFHTKVIRAVRSISRSVLIWLGGKLKILGGSLKSNYPVGEQYRYLVLSFRTCN